jgi:hypothetical protein
VFESLCKAFALGVYKYAGSRHSTLNAALAALQMGFGYEAITVLPRAVRLLRRPRARRRSNARRSQRSRGVELSAVARSPEVGVVQPTALAGGALAAAPQLDSAAASAASSREASDTEQPDVRHADAATAAARPPPPAPLTRKRSVRMTIDLSSDSSSASESESPRRDESAAGASPAAETSAGAARIAPSLTDLLVFGDEESSSAAADFSAAGPQHGLEDAPPDFLDSNALEAALLAILEDEKLHATLPEPRASPAPGASATAAAPSVPDAAAAERSPLVSTDGDGGGRVVKLRAGVLKHPLLAAIVAQQYSARGAELRSDELLLLRHRSVTLRISGRARASDDPPNRTVLPWSMLPHAYSGAREPLAWAVLAVMLAICAVSLYFNFAPQSAAPQPQSSGRGPCDLLTLVMAGMPFAPTPDAGRQRRADTAVSGRRAACKRQRLNPSVRLLDRFMHSGAGGAHQPAAAADACSVAASRACARFTHAASTRAQRCDRRAARHV